MLKPEQVPDEVVETFVDAFYGKDMTRKAAIAAAINAWPGFEYSANGAFPAFGYGPEAIILSLPQKERSE